MMDGVDRPRERGEETGEEIGVGLRRCALLPFSALQGRNPLSTFYWQLGPAPRRPDWLASARKPAPISCCAPGGLEAIGGVALRESRGGASEPEKKERERGVGEGKQRQSRRAGGRRYWNLLQAPFFGDLWTFRPGLRLSQSHSGLGSCCLTVQRFSKRVAGENPEPNFYPLLCEIWGRWVGELDLIRPGEKHGSKA